MTDWIKHDGENRPADEVWVEVKQNDKERPTYICSGRLGHWPRITGYRVLNQHLIDAARLEGIRLGLEAKMRWQSSSHPALRPRLLMPDPETIAREADLDKLASEAQKQGMGYEKEADQ